MKTIRLTRSGMPKESMSFKNIDYFEVAENDNWTESEAYEIFTNRFLFVIFKPIEDKKIKIINTRTHKSTEEQAYMLDKVFFWTMPPEDLERAQEYWEDIRKNVLANRIDLSAFWSIRDHRNLHVRPKGTKQNHTTANPNGGICENIAIGSMPITLNL